MAKIPCWNNKKNWGNGEWGKLKVIVQFSLAKLICSNIFGRDCLNFTVVFERLYNQSVIIHILNIVRYTTNL